MTSNTFVFGFYCLNETLSQNENVALLEAQLAQLRAEKHFLLNSVVNSQKKDEVIQILVDQLKYNAPRPYLIETAAHIRKITSEQTDAGRTRDKDIDRVCHMLEAPVDLVTCRTFSNCTAYKLFLFFHISSRHLLLFFMSFAIFSAAEITRLNISVSFRVMALFISIYYRTIV